MRLFVQLTVSCVQSSQLVASYDIPPQWQIPRWSAEEPWTIAYFHYHRKSKPWHSWSLNNGFLPKGIDTVVIARKFSNFDRYTPGLSYLPSMDFLSEDLKNHVDYINRLYHRNFESWHSWSILFPPCIILSYDQLWSCTRYVVYQVNLFSDTTYFTELYIIRSE